MRCARNIECVGSPGGGVIQARYEDTVLLAMGRGCLCGLTFELSGRRRHGALDSKRSSNQGHSNQRNQRNQGQVYHITSPLKLPAPSIASTAAIRRPTCATDNLASRDSAVIVMPPSRYAAYSA